MISELVYVQNQNSKNSERLPKTTSQNLIGSKKPGSLQNNSHELETTEESKTLNKAKVQSQEMVNSEIVKKRGRKKGKGKELQDLLEQYQGMQKPGIENNLSQEFSQNSKNSVDTKALGQIQFLDSKSRPKRNTSPTKFQVYDNLMSTEEERMLKLAIKNSLVECASTPTTLDDIPEVKTYHPSLEEFQNPIDYIEKLYKEGASQYGIIKIVPPKSFKPILAFDQFSNQILPSRFQVLQDLGQGKPFDQNFQGHTFGEFAQISKSIETEQTEEDFWNLEKEYWNYVENQVGPRQKVEYAADLNVTVFGSGFGRHGQPVFDHRIRHYLDHPWNLNNLYKQHNSLMQFPRSKDISGINIPWLYIGMKHSTFCWHYEDLALYSINYNHWGKPKLWYGVPEDQREKFEKAVKTKLALLFKKDPNILLDIITMISPAYIASQKVKVYKTLQMPGEYILTFPGAYHAGFSTGLNIGEAVNFVSKSWFDYGLQCQEVYRKSREKIPVFPIDWLVVENLQNLDKVNLDLETLQKLKETFTKILKEEKKARDIMEKQVKAYQESHQSQSQKPIYEMLPNRDKVAEDQHQCNYCTDFAFLSMIQCKHHKINYCLFHNIMCGCPIENVNLIYRYTTKELEKMDKSIQDACAQKDAEINGGNSGQAGAGAEHGRIKKKIFKNIEESKVQI